MSGLRRSVESFEVAASQAGQEKSQPLFVRIVTPQIRPDKVDEFKKAYVEEILPALRTVKGCRYAYLTENVQEKNRIISITIWDRKQRAEEYEQSGIFSSLTHKLEHTFSEVYQWKMRLQKESKNQVMTSEEISVDGYTIVTGATFGP
jgi:quinol monooxygenase YgiN